MATLLDRRYQAQYERLRKNAAAVAQRTWLSLGSYDQKDVDRFVRVTVEGVTAAQRNAVALTDAFMARASGGRVLGLPVKELTGAAVRNGVALEEVYQRPFVQTWAALGNGVPYKEAVSGGLSRAVSVAMTDVALASRAAADAYARRSERIVGFRRVTDGAACALCVKASSQTYYVGDLMPIHNHCGCTVSPIMGERPARSEPPDDVAIHIHGEMGPVLTRPGDTFTEI